MTPRATTTHKEESAVTDKIHVRKVGTYHPAPEPIGIHSTDCDVAKGQSSPSCALCNYVAWTINDTRGYTDSGPACDECGACECGPCEHCDATHESDHTETCPNYTDGNTDGECIGLSFAYVCLDGGDSLCEECATKAGIEIVPCDCE